MSNSGRVQEGTGIKATKKALLLVLLLPLGTFIATAFVSFPASGAHVVSTEHATVTLLSEQPQATAGQTLWLGLQFKLIPHWHVYWRNPGASGTAPVIHWTLPAGWKAGDIHWPVPKRIRVGPLTNPGDISHATQYVRVALQEVGAGKPVSTPVTRPYGCSVKYKGELFLVFCVYAPRFTAHS